MTGSTTGTTQLITVQADFDNCSKKLDLQQLLAYKKNFQNFWVRFIEQFIPSTTIFISGEKWCTKDEQICPTIDDCGYDNIFSKSDLGLLETDGGLKPGLKNKNNNLESEVFLSEEKVTSKKDGGYSDNKNNEPIILNNFIGSFLKKDDSVLKEKRLTLVRGELPLLRKGKIAYQNKFTQKIYILEK